MTTRIITRWRVDITSLTTSMSTMRFLIEIIFILKAIKSHLKGSYDKQYLHFYTHQRPVILNSFEMTASLRSSVYHMTSLFFQWITSCHQNMMATRVTL